MKDKVATLGEPHGNPSNSSLPPENLNSLLETMRKKYGLPALAGSAVTSNGLLGVGAVGVRKYGCDTLVTVDDQFHLGSNTKAMTATMLATLVEEGKLSWSTTLEQAFSELARKMHSAYRKVTLNHLLAHRAGFPEASWPRGKSFADMHGLPGMPREQRRAYVAMVLGEPPVCQNYAVAWIAPARDFAVLVMTNQAGGPTFKACDEAATALISHVIKNK